MRVAVNALSLGRHRTGTGNFTYYVLKELLDLGGTDRFVCFVPSDALPQTELGLAGAEWYTAGHTIQDAARHVFWEHVVLPVQVRAKQADVLFCPSYLVPIFLVRTPAVIAVHDLSFLIYPESKSALFGAYMRRLLPLSLRRARTIITGSSSTKEQLHDRFPFTEAKTVVVPYGVDFDTFKPRENAQETVSGVMGVRERYVLAVGTVEERKNLSRLIQAFSKVRASFAEPLKLVIVGGSGWGHSKVFATAVACGVEDQIVFAGHIDDPVLTALYSACAVFVQPSFYEGFGLPILEAMACGAPAVVSNCTSHPEVAGDSGLYFDPLSVEEMADQMLKVIQNQDLRAKLISDGLARAKRFSWSICAAKIRDCLQEASSR